MIRQDNPKEDGGLIHPAIGGFTLRLLLILFFLTPAVSSHASEHRIGEVFLISQKKGLTELVLRTSTELIPGLVVQVGKKEFAVVGPKQRQDDTGFYYEASIPEVSLIKQGDPVFWVPIGEFEAPPGKGGPEVLIEIRETIPFTPKRVGRITATQPPKVLVDKGSLHDVLRGDIFAVYDSTGRYKGQIEVRMVGDLQAVAFVKGGKSQAIRKGDRIVFLGQKKILSMGFTVAGPRIPRKLTAVPIGGGILLDLTFSRGWVLEFNFGAYHPGFRDEREVDPNNPHGPPLRLSVRRVYFLLPVTIRKHFFWPRTISPYLGAGFATFFRQLTGGGKIKEIRVFPMPHLQAGIELFSGRFFRPRVEARYFFGPKVDGLSTNSLFFGIGFTAGVGG